MSTNRQSDFYREFVRTKKSGDLKEDRIQKIVAAYNPATLDLLDVGCGNGVLLEILRERSTLDRVVGVDVAPDTAKILAEIGIEGHSLDAGAPLPFPDQTFDTITCGEVIEHVFDVDTLIAEFFRVLRPGGMLILTTPNLAYTPNRLMLLAGIQPLFTETSLTANLGRKWRILGQGGRTQGHLRIYTLAALQELLAMHGFRRQEVVGYRWLQSGALGFVDRLLAQRPSLAAGFVARAYRGA